MYSNPKVLMSRQGKSGPLPDYEEMKPFQTSHHGEFYAEGSLWYLFHSSASLPTRQQPYTDGRKPKGKAHYHKYYLMLFP